MRLSETPARFKRQPTPQDKYLRVQYGIGRLLSESRDREGLPKAVIEILCDGLNCDAACWWEPYEGLLHCTEFLATRSGEFEALESACRTAALPSGQGLPGVVFKTAQPSNVDDFRSRDDPRVSAALRDSVQSAAAFPITTDGEPLAVLEIFGRNRRQFDSDLLDALSIVGAQIGNLIERLHAEKELRASEERYRRLVERSPEPIAVHQDGLLVFVNRAAVDMWGAESAEELLGRPILDLIHKDYQPLVRERIRQVLEQDITAELMEEKFVRLDGAVVDVEVLAIRTSFEGRPAYQLMARDMSERKRAEAERRRAEERYIDLFRNSVVGVFQTTPDGKFLNANPALARIFGYESPEALIAAVSNIGDQIHADPARRAEFAARIEAEESVTGFEARAIRQDGSAFEISLSGRVVRDENGRAVAYEGFVEDISARKRAEDQLKEQKRVVETVEQVGASLASELDLNRAVQSVIDAATELTRAQFAAFIFRPPASQGEGVMIAKASDANGRDLEELQSPNEVSGLETALPGPGIVRSEDISTDARLEESREVVKVVAGNAPVRSYLAVPVFSRNGSVAGGLFFAHERAGVFEERHETLAAGIARWAGIALDNASLYAEAQNIQEQLRLANETKDEFLGLVSHELRTPITTIYGGARLLQSRGSRLEQERKDELLSDIEQESERLYRLVEDLLALARTELGASVTLRPVLVQRVAEKVIAGFEKRRPNRPVELQLPRDLAPVLADPTYVEQILFNLLGNADKYSPADAPITVRAEANDERVRVEVMDRGFGIDGSEASRLFERFYRAERTARQAGGLGIGLTVCKRLVEAQGGDVWAQEREGGGLIVGFSIPVASEDGPANE